MPTEEPRFAGLVKSGYAPNFSAFSITALIVPDEDGRPLGLIHLHDILKQGIV
jgi:high-affinity K+ transport system ATPase subunit B